MERDLSPSYRQQGLHPAEMERGKGRQAQAKSEREDGFTGIVKYVVLLHSCIDVSIWSSNAVIKNGGRNLGQMRAAQGSLG